MVIMEVTNAKILYSMWYASTCRTKEWVTWEMVIWSTKYAKLINSTVYNLIRDDSRRKYLEEVVEVCILTLDLYVPFRVGMK